MTGVKSPRQLHDEEIEIGLFLLGRIFAFVFVFKEAPYLFSQLTDFIAWASGALFAAAILNLTIYLVRQAT